MTMARASRMKAHLINKIDKTIKINVTSDIDHSNSSYLIHFLL